MGSTCRRGSCGLPPLGFGRPDFGYGLSGTAFRVPSRARISAHELAYHSTPGSRVINEKEEGVRAHDFGNKVLGTGFRMLVFASRPS